MTISSPIGAMTGDSLLGLSVLALLPPDRSDDARVIVRPIEAAKRRWGWTVSGLYLGSDRAAYQPLVAPQGKLFTRPGFLEVADWEGDPAKVEAMDRKISEAERASGVPVGQLICGSASTIGRGYVVSARHRLGSPMARRILDDNMEPYRIFRRFFAFGETMLDDAKPGIVISFEWATPLHAAVWLAAAGRGIPRICVRRSKVVSDRYFWTADRLMFNVAAREAALASRASADAMSERAAEQIRKFREQPKMVAYIQTKWTRVGDKKKRKNWLKRPIQLAKKFAVETLYPGKARDTALSPGVLERFVAARRRHIMARRHRKYFKSYGDAELERIKYIYFPMHKETDLPLTYQATGWHDQRSTVSVLASALPAGYRLFVREHRLNYGQRPTAYYTDMLKLPGVVLIDAFDSQFKYVRNADLIVTENGSSGWEGQILGRRVIALSGSAYEGTGLARKVETARELGRSIVGILNGPMPDQAAQDAALGRMIDCEWYNTFPLTEGDVDEAALRQLATLVSSMVRERPPASTVRGDAPGMRSEGSVEAVPAQ